jgi:double-strand break repair protein MRE11
MPDEETIAAMTSIDNVKVEKLVREFLLAQSLKILPRTHFGAAVTEYVVKDDKRAMENFVDESLTHQVKEMLSIEGEELDLDDTMDQIRAREEELWASGLLQKSKTAHKFKPRPENWDSDTFGEWEDDPAALLMSGDEESIALTSKRGRGAFSDDDDASVVSALANKKAPAKKAPAKKAPAKPRAPAKAKAAQKAPARGRKKVVEISDDEEEDMIMQDDSLPAKSQPKRAAVVRGQQTRLNFSQPLSKTQTAKELSDDELSEDDAFEPMVSSSRRR